MTSRKPQLRVVSKTAAPPPDDAPQSDLPSGLDDIQLLAAIRRGDRSAAGAVYDRARPIVERVVNRLLGSADSDAPDLAQQALVEIIFTANRYRGECSLNSWISTLTAHVVWKHLRRRRLERRLFGDALYAESVFTSPLQLGKTTVLRGLLDRVITHLRAIGVARAAVLVLHDVHGYDMREIATIIGTTVAAAQARLSRGRRDLHDRIARDPDLADALDRTGEGPS